MTRTWTFAAPAADVRRCALCGCPIRDERLRKFCGSACRSRAAFWRSMDARR